MIENTLVTKKTKTNPSLCFLITTMGIGGAEIQVMNLAKKFKEKGWDVIVISLMPKLSLKSELSLVNIPLVSLNIRRRIDSVKGLFRLVRILKKWKPDILNCHMDDANFLGRISRLFYKVPVLVSTVHNNGEKSKWRAFVYIITEMLSDITVTISKTSADRYLKIKAVQKRKLQIIPNGVSIGDFYLDKIRKKVLKRKFVFEKKFVWLAVGNLRPQKDYETLIEAFSKVVSKHNDSVLLIVGQGLLKDRIKMLVEKLNLSGKVRILGRRKDIADLMKLADAYVMSSVTEGMPLVLLEASASGLPIVATDVGGNKEVVIKNKTGFLVPARDPDALSRIMLAMIELPKKKREKMGTIARKFVKDNYSLERVTKVWETLYLGLLEKKDFKISEE